MSQKPFQICNIITESEVDHKILLEYLGNYPISISRNWPEELYFEVPTLVVGWNSIKNIYTNQNIFDKQISNNLYWSFSKEENEKEFFLEIESFFNKSIQAWLPSNFILYDCFLNNDNLKTFLEININKDKNVFIHFSGGALYIYNDEKSFTINIKSLAAINSKFKDEIANILNDYNLIAFSYMNVYNYVNIDLLKRITTIDNLRWVKYGVETLESYFKIIPNFKVSKFIPFLMSKLKPIHLDSEEQAFYNRMCERDKITCWLSTREIALKNEFDNKNLFFKYRRGYKLTKINYSNKRTITGRITSQDSYNPQNLPRETDERKNIISRFENGQILVFDYVSFEPKISVYETKNLEYIKKYKNKDLHREAAILLYENTNITESQRNLAKSITNPLLYGEGENSLLNKLSIFSDPTYKLYQIKNFLNPIIEKSKEINNFVKEHGYIITPLNSIIKPDKQYAGYNNYIQAYASEIIVDKLLEIKNLLGFYKTEFIFQVHDSLVFDLHSSEIFLINQIKEILSTYNNMEFDLSINIGANYKDLKNTSYILSN